MALIKTYKGLSPKWGRDCYFSENATLVGDVTLGDECSVWFNAVVRGDVAPITIGDRNIYQYDTTIINKHTYDTSIFNHYRYDTTLVFDTLIVNGLYINPITNCFARSVRYSEL